MVLVSELALKLFIPLVIVFQFQRSLYNDPNRDPVPNIYKRKLKLKNLFLFGIKWWNGRIELKFNWDGAAGLGNVKFNVYNIHNNYSGSWAPLENLIDFVFCFEFSENFLGRGGWSWIKMKEHLTLWKPANTSMMWVTTKIKPWVGVL